MGIFDLNLQKKGCVIPNLRQWVVFRHEQARRKQCQHARMRIMWEFGHAWIMKNWKQIESLLSQIASDES